LNQLKIYKSSAGSGKTYTLVKEYLRLVLEKPDEYKHILAITFTNKATEEMKSRIISSLIDLSNDKNETLKTVLADDIPLIDIKKNAQRALDYILHDYSNFSVCTIDSFFNRIIRSLAREIHLPLRLETQLNMDEVVEEITSMLLSEVGNDAELSQWLTDFLFQKLRDDKGWGIESEIASIASELFKEKSIDNHLHTRQQIHQFFKELKEIRSSFEAKMKAIGEKALQSISIVELSVDDFSYKSGGVAGYFEKITNNAKADNYVPGSRVLSAAESVESWCAKSSQKRAVILPLVENRLLPLLRSALNCYEKEFPRYSGAVEVLKRIFLLGIVEDIKKKLQQYRTENNMLLISDTPKILSEVISAEEAPFVYEKAGSRYHHFLIDEFQDTSDLQWNNLLPLVINSLADGNFSMIVGDVKQSIYRWRSGNMNLLASEIKRDLKNFHSVIKEENLDTNFRSKKQIVDFNNIFFKAVPSVINEILELDEDHLLNTSYEDGVIQNVTEKNASGGYVEVQFISSKEEEDEPVHWKDAAKEKLLASIHKLETKGCRLGDMAILVRNNREGDDVATFLIENGITKVISPDSLLLIRSQKVRFLINVMRYLDNSYDRIAKSDILYSFNRLNNGSDKILHSIFSESANAFHSKAKKQSGTSLFEPQSFNETLFNKLLPEAFTEHLISLSKLPVYELCEQLLNIFQLNNPDAYVYRFLELVLEYSGKHDSSVKSFLQWWDESPAVQNTAVITAESEDAIRIMTIHRSKGLQFPIVFMPFTEWKLKPDSRDVLWVTSDTQPFDGYGKIPLSASKSLLNSVFKEDYEKEIVMSATDNINLLYVAFTRSEEQLYIYCAEGSAENMNSVSKLIRKVLETNDDWKKQIVVDDSLILGESSFGISKSGKARKEDMEIKTYETLHWHEHIRLSTHSDDLIEMLNTPAASAINYGVLVHRILSSIEDVSEISRAVEEVFFEGLINEEEKASLEKEISEVLAIEEIRHFFSRDKDEYRVMSERELILPSGEMLRPDRVLLKDKHAIIIDFKTGKENKSHEKQVNQYADILKQMNYSPIEKYLVYLSERRVKSVV
jgi:ATP-dependent exoDNAse (exonuclease V) beta subunit